MGNQKTSMFLSYDILYYAWREENSLMVRLQEYPKITLEFHVITITVCVSQ